MINAILLAVPVVLICALVGYSFFVIKERSHLIKQVERLAKMLTEKLEEVK